MRATGTAPAPDRYRVLVAVGLVLALYTHLPVYGASFWWSGLQPVHWIMALCVALLPTVLSPSVPKWTSREVLPAWVAVYTCATLVWYVGFGAERLDPLKVRVVGIVVLCAAYVAFRGSDSTILWARRAMLGAMLVAVAANLYNATHPFAFLPIDHDSATPGRASGFYMNPNVAGAAILSALILGISSVKHRWRAALLIAAGVGVAVTVSRSAILAWLIVWGACGWTGIVPRSHFVLSTLVTSVVAVLGFGILISYFDLVVGVDWRDVLERLAWFADPSAVQDASRTSRQEIAIAAWQAFTESPLAGSGLGATDTWHHSFSTHNMFLRLMVEQGVLGGLLFVSLLVVVLWRVPSRYRLECTMFASFLFYWAWFSHNILDEYPLQIAIALSAAMAAAPEGREGECGSRF